MKTLTKYIPILFRGELVLRIMEGLKTQTRRVMRPQPEPQPGHRGKHWWSSSRHQAMLDVEEMLQGGDPAWDGIQNDACPYGRPGDRLWVRETWRPYEDPKTCIDGVLFKADGSFRPIENTKEAADKWLDARGEKGTKVWRPSIFMPRWACRLEIEIVKVRVERLQEITTADAKAEGVTAPLNDNKMAFDQNGGMGYIEGHDYRTPFHHGWDKINAKRGFGWDANPWLWVLDFKRVTS